MKHRIKDVVPSLDFSELMKIRKDLDSGAIHLRKLIDEEIRNKEKTHEQLCSVCSNKIHPEDSNNFTLVFGPESFRKKATFCAIDCLQYFLKNIRDRREHKVETTPR